jgi:hypothetical protein
MPALFPVQVGQKSGFIDQKGKMVIKPQFDAAGDFSEGMAVIVEYDREGRRDQYETLLQKVGFINEKGETVIPPRFQYAQDFSNGLAAVFDGKKWGYVNTKGEWVIEPAFDNGNDFSEGLLVA